MTIFSPRRFMAASSGRASFPLGGVLTCLLLCRASEPGRPGTGCDVVDEPCLADAYGGGEDALAVEVGDLDVVDVEAGCSERRARAASTSFVASARGRASAASRSSGER